MTTPFSSMLLVFGAGIIGSIGKNSGGKYRGIASNVNLINLRVLNSEGAGSEGDGVAIALMVTLTVGGLAATRVGPVGRSTLTGMSMGGAGTWSLASREPRRFSAIAVICGWVRRPPNLTDLADVADRYDTLAQRLGKLPIWLLHGSADNVVPVTESRAMADALGANAAYTEFPGVKHNSWDPAYETTGVVEWLVKQKRP